MAKRQGRGGAARGAGTRQAKAKSKKAPVAQAEVEVVEEAPGEGVDSGVAIATTIILVASILFLDALLGRYDVGVFF